MVITNIEGTVKLNNGIDMPYFGLGTYTGQDGIKIVNAIKWALHAGYRHIDTAAQYKNESSVGNAILESGIARKDIFLTTKLWNSDQGYYSTLKAFKISSKKLKTKYVDLYLIHWPIKGKIKQTWKAMEELYFSGKARSIGVSNFLPHHIEELKHYANVLPMVNQIEFHPFLLQQQLLNYCSENSIQVVAWSPLMKGKVFEINNIQQLAQKHNKNAAQIILRWNLQKGVATIPKSFNQDRIISNADIFDFSLSSEDLALIEGLDKEERIGAHPDIVVWPKKKTLFERIFRRLMREFTLSQ